MCCATKSICCNWRSLRRCKLLPIDAEMQNRNLKSEIRNWLSFRLPFIFSWLLENLLHCTRSFVEMSNLKQNCNLPWSLDGVWVLCRVSHIKWIFDLHHILIENICKEFSFLYICNLFFLFDWLKIVYSCSLEHLAALAQIRNLHLLPDIASAAVSCILTMCFIPTAVTRKLTVTQIQRGRKWEGEEWKREKDVEIFKLQDKWKFISLAQTICLSWVFSL